MIENPASTTGQIYNLFPVPLGYYKLPRALTALELMTIQSFSQKSNTGNRVSADDQVCENHALSDITIFLKSCLNEFVQQVHASTAQVGICSSWINWSKQGEYHHKHTHSNSFISGVFYVQTNPDDKIWFHKDQHQWIYLESSQYTLWNSQNYYYTVTPGDLYLFPSNISHSVDKVQGDQERISLSFNTWPQGILGTSDTKTKLTLT